MFDIIHILTGDEHLPPSFDSMQVRVLEKQRSDFELIAWAGCQKDLRIASLLVDVYQQMPPIDRAHFLLSPDMFEQIADMRSFPTRDGIASLLKSCTDELAVSRRQPEHSDIREVIWSPMGDEWLVRTAEGYQLCAAAEIGGSIAVDFDSPAALIVDLTSGCMCNPPELYGDLEREVVVDKLRNALAHIDLIAPSFGRMIRGFTRIIRIRKSNQVEGYASEEVPSRPGEIRILNPHRVECDINALAETIIHEGVHSMLAVYEKVVGPFVVVPSDRRYRPVSPWTGNPIPVESFAHAVLVWFALFQFALREHASPGHREEDVLRIVRQLNRCASGFCIPSMLSTLIDGEAAYQSGFFETINTLQGIVLTLIEDMNAGRLKFLTAV